MLMMPSALSKITGSLVDNLIDVVDEWRHIHECITHMKESRIFVCVELFHSVRT